MASATFGWTRALEPWNAQLLRSRTGFLEFCAEVVAHAHIRMKEEELTLRATETTRKMLRLEALLSTALGQSSLDLGNPLEEFLAQIRKAMDTVEWKARVERDAGGSARLRRHAFMRGWDEANEHLLPLRRGK